jgi:hypothetical protein
MARQSTPPGVGHAADQGVTNIPSPLPPTEPPAAPDLPDAAENMSLTGVDNAQTTEWFG